MPQIGELLTKHEIAALYGLDIGDGRGGYGQWGVWHLKDRIVLIVTLDHARRPEAHRYPDHFEAPDLLVWDAQPETTPETKKGREYAEHRARGVPVELYARGQKFEKGRQLPFVYLGQVQESGWTGPRPMTVRWRLDVPVPAEHHARLHIPSAREAEPAAGTIDWRHLDDEAARVLSLVASAVDAGDYSADDSLALAPVRAGQALFRERVLRLHGFKCCVCGIADPRLLDASHILPWRGHRQHRLDARNGLALCALHHRAFDRGIMVIMGDGVIQVLGTVEGDAVWQKAVAAFHGQPMAGNLPEVRRSLQEAAALRELPPHSQFV